MWNKILVYLSCLLFCLILIIPYQMQFLKLGLVFILLLPIVLKYIKKDSFLINRNILTWTYTYVLMGLFYIIYALLKGNPAPMLYFPVYVIWPILFFLLIIQSDNKMYMRLISCMRIAFTIISVLGIIAFLEFNISLNAIKEFLMFKSTVRPGFPFVAIASGTITNMIFLYVFFWTLYIIDRKALKKLDKLNLILGFVFIFATSRRVIFLILMISVIFSALLIYLLDLKDKKVYIKSLKSFFRTVLFFIVIIVAIVSYFELFDFEDIWKFIGSAIGSDSAGIGYDPRLLQADSLLEGWLEYPIIGNGTGINASVIRSETPGMYELSYMAMLFERGLFGTLVYAIQFLLLNYWTIKSFRNGVLSSNYCIATLVAFDMFMFANATNPYLYAFDHLWVIFMVLAVINLNQKSDEKNMYINKSV